MRLVFVIATTLVMSAAVARATEEQEETLGDKLKKLFVRSTPTPTPKPKPQKKKRSSPTPTVSPSAAESPPETAGASPAESASAAESPLPTAPIEAQRTEPQAAQPQYFAPVRPISPGPRSRRRAPVNPAATARIVASPIATPSASETPLEVRTPIPSESETSRPLPSVPPVVEESAAPLPRKTPAPTVTAAFSADAIADSQSYSSDVRKIVDLGFELAKQNLNYKYVSADPAKGGMDSSGFISYVLSKSGVNNVPRDAREQYIWVRKAGNFQAVLAQRDDTFELDALKPGDLLFWATNYGVSRDPEITQTMIYLGREKATNQRLMVGASETQTPKGRSRPGVGVFDFKIGKPAKGTKEGGPFFVGYGRIPGPQ